MVQLAKRMLDVPPYLFADLDKKRDAAVKRGVDVISLSIGDPDLPTPAEIVAAGQAAMADASNHQYPAYAGSVAFRQAAANWMKRRFSQEFDFQSEVVALIGTKEGIGHLPLVMLDPGDTVLVPEPGYPVYAISSRFVGGQVHYMPLLAERGFMPDLDAIPSEVCAKAKVLWINYPNNPTGAVASDEFLQKAVDFAIEHDVVLCSDNAYSEISFDGYRAKSIFEFEGSREVAVEFHSLSKTYNMTGWRVGFAVGRADVIGGLGDLKSNIDSGVFTAIQVAGIKAMEIWPGPVEKICAIYAKRRDLVVDGLRACGYEVESPKATFYLWMRVPGGDDAAFASRLIEEAGVIVTPGSGFGPSGKGHVRFSLSVSDSRLTEAIERIKRL